MKGMYTFNPTSGHVFAAARASKLLRLPAVATPSLTLTAPVKLLCASQPL